MISHNVLYPFPLSNNPGFSRPWERGLLKTQQEKEKMLVTSISTFSHNIFYSITEKLQHLTLKAPYTTIVAFVASVDQDQAHKMCSLIFDLYYPL